MSKDFSINKLECYSTILWKGIPLFNIQDACKFLDLCEEFNIAVLGIEGFKIINDYRIPDMECIVDFSEIMESMKDDFPKYSRQCSLDFIKNYVNDDVLIEFEIVVVVPSKCPNK